MARTYETLLVRLRQATPWLQLSMVVATMLLVWGVLLPRLCRQPHIRAAQDWVEANQLDVSAMFYSELPALDESLARARSLRRRDKQVLWSAGREGDSRPSP